MKMINWGIIGCGDVTEVKSGPAFNKVNHSFLAAVMRRDTNKAKDYAIRHQVPKWYSDAKEIIHNPGINAIYIATPPAFHEQYTIAALEAGKAVYVEKPVATNAVACQRMLDTALKTNVPLTVAHYRRAQPLFMKIKELLDQKIIGNVHWVNLQYLQPQPGKEALKQDKMQWRVNPSLSGGGLFHDIAPHQIDLMLYFFGKVTEIQGLSANQGKAYQADDIVCSNLLFESGVMFQGTWCFSMPSEEKRDICEIIGSEGKIVFNFFGDPLIQVFIDGKSETFQFERLQHVQQPMIERTVEYFMGREPNPCSAEEALAVMHIMDQVTFKSTGL